MKVFANTEVSHLSIQPPCPGRALLKSLRLYARLNPEAKNPANGVTKDVKNP